jgi:hypothetical protein
MLSHNYLQVHCVCRHNIWHSTDTLFTGNAPRTHSCCQLMQLTEYTASDKHDAAFVGKANNSLSVAGQQSHSYSDLPQQHNCHA